MHTGVRVAAQADRVWQMAQTASEKKQFLQSLERGMAVIQVFSREHPSLTLSEVARLTGITRATARRILLTLERLGHVRSDGRYFSLTPRVLTLGWAYLSSLNLWEIAQPLMEDLVDQTKESCSAATLDLPDIVYVARVPTRRIMTITLGVGTRLPAHATSMGRVLLADLPEDELEAFLAGTQLQRFTETTITDPAELTAALREVRAQGFAFVDEELEIGLRSIAAPVTGRDGRTIAAVNVSAAAARVSIDEMRERFLPALLQTTELISASLLSASHGPRRF
jgi:IclR family transcriptional regulator, pca regulon regulatory protein